MTTEDDFHRALDKNPQDWHTRLVFADWLQDRGDVRAAGYRAIAAQQRRPLEGTHGTLNKQGWWWHCPGTGTRACHNDIPADWFALLPQKEGNDSFWPLHTATGGLRTRAECEDALARAFAKLPPERQTELLAGPTAAPPKGGKKSAKKKK